MIFAELNPLADGGIADVRAFDRVLLTVSNMPTGGAITLYGAAKRGSAFGTCACVKESDLTVAQTITANGSYSCDALADFKWSLTTPGTGGPPTVDVIAKG